MTTLDPNVTVTGVLASPADATRCQMLVNIRAELAVCTTVHPGGAVCGEPTALVAMSSIPSPELTALGTVNFSVVALAVVAADATNAIGVAPWTGWTG